MKRLTNFKKLFSIALAGVVFTASTILGISAASADSTSYEKVYFATGSSKLSAATKKELRSIAKTYSTATAVDVTGYVQKGTSTSNNKSLAKARAKAVVKYLKARGMTATFTYTGHGLPHSKSSSSKARRVTLELTTATPAATTAKVSGTFVSTVPGSNFLPIRSVLPTCADIGNLKVTLDGASDFASQEIDVAADCSASYSIPDVAFGTYTVVATVDLGATLAGFNPTVVLSGWTSSLDPTSHILTLTKTDLVVSADTTLDIKPTFTWPV